MKSELANKLKEILDNMSQEQFDQEWSKITALNMGGPSFADAIEYFSADEEVFKIINDFCFDWNYNYKGELSQKQYLIEWFEQFKKK
jgi:hypothetical protein